MNAIAPDVIEAIEAGLERAATDGARAVVITGSGGVFCAGADLKHVLRGLDDLDAVEALLARASALMRTIERHPTPATEASGIAVGVFHPQVSRDDSLLSRLTRSGFLYGMHRWRAIEDSACRFSWARCGVLQMAKDASEEARMAATVRALGFPPEYVEFCSRAIAGKHAGGEVRAGGWWFPDSGWAHPAELVTALLVAARAGGGFTVRLGAGVHALERRGEQWHARSAEGAVIASAPAVVLANSHDATRLVPVGTPLKRVRGQLTRLPAGSFTAPVAVLAGAGHLIPGADGAAVVGATYDFDDEDPEPRAAGHGGNLARLERLVPGMDARFDPAALTGSVGFRCVSADRLPLIGALPDAGAMPTGGAARDWPRLPGLYGAFAYASRGLTWAALGGELIASAMEGEPLPLEDDLADAVDPARFLLRRARRAP